MSPYDATAEATELVEMADGDLTGPAQGSKQLRRFTPDDGSGAAYVQAGHETGRGTRMDDWVDST